MVLNLHLNSQRETPVMRPIVYVQDAGGFERERWIEIVFNVGRHPLLRPLYPNFLPQGVSLALQALKL